MPSIHCNARRIVNILRGTAAFRSFSTLCSCSADNTAKMSDEPKADKKAAYKEGGKKGTDLRLRAGVDLAGMCDMGGVKHFNIAVQTPNGDIELLKEVLAGANKEVDESAEERKGGAGHIGKCFYSAGDVHVALVCHVPKELAAEKELTAREWFDTVCTAMQGEVEILEETDEIVVGVCKASKEKELFPLKMRDAGSSAGYQMLLKKGLIPQDDSDDYIPDPEAAGIEW